jgi:hypothetical protein
LVFGFLACVCVCVCVRVCVCVCFVILLWKDLVLRVPEKGGVLIHFSEHKYEAQQRGRCCDRVSHLNSLDLSFHFKRDKKIFCHHILRPGISQSILKNKKWTIFLSECTELLYFERNIDRSYFCFKIHMITNFYFKSIQIHS